jgi:DtxR family Mn-dependent transcriptional regulator
MENKLAPRLEDYLETIYILEKEKGVARVRDIAKLRHVKMPTVTEVLKRLSQKGYVHYEPYGFVRVTDKGKKYAEDLLAKHGVLTKFMRDILLLPEELAEKEGCLMEHHLSDETITRIKVLTSYLLNSGVLEKFREHFKNEG